MEELRTLVIYDIEDDRIRLKISETCLDYGLGTDSIQRVSRDLEP